jgi:hypothetical protein
MRVKLKGLASATKLLASGERGGPITTLGAEDLALKVSRGLPSLSAPMRKHIATGASPTFLSKPSTMSA